LRDWRCMHLASLCYSNTSRCIKALSQVYRRRYESRRSSKHKMQQKSGQERFSIWRPFATFNFRGLIMLIFKSPCRTVQNRIRAHYNHSWSFLVRPSPLPPVGHIWDVMLVWRKGNIEKTVSLLQLWPGWLTIGWLSVLWHCWLVIWPVKSSPKWPMSSGTLNTTILYNFGTSVTVVTFGTPV